MEFVSINKMLFEKTLKNQNMIYCLDVALNDGIIDHEEYTSTELVKEFFKYINDHEITDENINSETFNAFLAVYKKRK